MLHFVYAWRSSLGIGLRLGLFGKGGLGDGVMGDGGWRRNSLDHNILLLFMLLIAYLSFGC